MTFLLLNPERCVPVVLLGKFATILCNHTGKTMVSWWWSLCTPKRKFLLIITNHAVIPENVHSLWTVFSDPASFILSELKSVLS